MKRKGSSETIALAIVGIVIFGLMAVIGINRMTDLDDRIRVRTVEIPADRMGPTIDMASALDEAEIEISFDVEHGIVRKNGGVHLNYTHETLINWPGSDKNSHPIESKVGLDEIKEGVSDDICIRKKSGEISIAAEEC
ncbi:MAG: hypothetical protein H8Z69_03025 [Nanohaloarchaea archaeon]|nr:hypothetical protein [Candidatus Nanohaloarchaea archaeon]